MSTGLKRGLLIIGSIGVLVLILGFVWRTQGLAAIRASLPEGVSSEAAPAGFQDEVARVEAQVTYFSKTDEILLELAMVYHANRFFDQSVSLYSNLLDGDYANPKWHYLLADVYQSMMDFEGYESSLRRFEAEGGDYAAGFFALGNLELRKGNLNEAEALFQRAMDLEPDALPVYDAMRRVKRAMGKPAKKGGATSGKAKGAIPDPWLDEVAARSFDVGQLMVRADASVLRGDFDMAVRLLDRAMAIDPNDWKPHAMRINVFAKKGLAQPALKAYDAAIYTGADEGGALAEISSLLISEGMTGKLVSLAERALGRAPDSADLYRLHAKALRKQGELREAEASLRKAAKLMPDSFEIQKELGEVLWERERYDAAVTYFLTAVELAPFESKSRAYLAQYYTEREQFSEAERFVEEALALEPGNKAMASLAADYFAKYGQREAQKGEWQTAHRLLRRSWEVSPSSLGVAKLLAKSLIDGGKRDEGIVVLQQIVERDSGMAEVQMTLAELFLEEGKLDEAREYYEGVLSAAAGKAGYARMADAARKRLSAIPKK